MASGIQFNNNSDHFEATYEHPWGGVASDAFDTDIQPNQFKQCDNLLIKDGVLNSSCFDSITRVAQASTDGYNIALVISTNGSTFFVTQDGNTIILGANNITSVVGTGINGLRNASCFEVINGKGYIFSQSQGKVYLFDPANMTPTQGITLVNSFVGGLYCCTIDSYLLTANTNQPTDTPAIKANRVNWSAPGAYSTWDPSIDRTSGFNALTDVSDYISGIFAMGNIGYVIWDQGLAQLTPTGIGIKPFDFTTLWASEKGIGCTYPNTFSQYGNTAIWGNDNDFYTFSSGTAPQSITGSARKAIYTDINAAGAANTQVYGTFAVGSAVINNSLTKSSTPELRYHLIIIQISQAGNQVQIIDWCYNTRKQQWTRITQAFSSSKQTPQFVNAVVCARNFYILSFAGGLSSYRQAPLLVLNYTYNGGTNFIAYYLSVYEADITFPTSAPFGIPAPTIIFKAEEMKLGRKPNIRGVAILATGSGTPRTINVSVQNDSRASIFSSITVTSPTPQVYISTGMFTDINPQLVLSSAAFDGTIIKAKMYGTYAEGELP